MTKEEAIKIIRDWNLDNDKMEVLSVIIPELKESEDERIRKELIQFLIDYPNLPNGKYCRTDFFNWLEKQGKNNMGISEATKENNLSKALEKETPESWNKFLDEQGEQKLAWSKEDEKMFDTIVADIQFTQKAHTREVDEAVYEWEINWLKSLKKRMQPQSIQELSKEVIIEYVDLGLPSGTLWKLVNEEDYYTFDEAVEKFSNQLPTKEQWEELKKNCKWVWKDIGYEVTGPNGNTIYLPANGYRNGAGVNNVYSNIGYYWSSTHYNKYYAWYAGFSDDSHGFDVYYGDHYYGHSVRLVK